MCYGRLLLWRRSLLCSVDDFLARRPEQARVTPSTPANSPAPPAVAVNKKPQPPPPQARPPLPAGLLTEASDETFSAPLMKLETYLLQTTPSATTLVAKTLSSALLTLVAWLFYSAWTWRPEKGAALLTGVRRVLCCV